jgi:hypothetical protein
MAYRNWGPDETGKTYSRWTVIEYAGNDKYGAYLWRCRCVCGKEATVRGCHLRRGISKSCGCLRSDVKRAEGKLRVREKNPQWRGGRSVQPSGYVLIKQADHPAATNNGYVAEHRLVMEKKIGRYLLPNETVHHKNGVKTDNREENLELWNKDHGYGVRVKDKINHAIEVLNKYAPYYKITDTRITGDEV